MLSNTNKFEREFYSKFIKVIDDYVPRIRSFLLAVSGGVDSITMLDLFKRLRDERKDIVIGVATYNHKLRPEADIEVEFVRQICLAKDIPFYTSVGDVTEYAQANKLSIEEAARELRYDFLEKISTENSYELIVTAHNANDLLETMILRLSKGTGPFGLTGLRLISKNRFRPLLFFTRSEIEEYAQSKNLEFVVDASNYDQHYERNYIRHSIVPLLRKLNPQIEKSALSLARSTWELDTFVDKLLASKPRYYIAQRLIFRLEEDTLLRVEQIRRYALEFFGKPIDREKIERFLKANKKSYKVSFWGDLGVEVSHGWVMMGDINKYEHFYYDFNIIIEEDRINIYPQDHIKINGYFIKFKVGGIISKECSNRIELEIRNWIEGDRTHEGKKLKEIFNEKRVPTFLRRLIPLVVINNKVVFIPKIYKSRVLDDIGLDIVSKGGINFES
ncbi:tRNA lysidine(34) synthetase TilS [Fervidobacterium sp.]